MYCKSFELSDFQMISVFSRWHCHSKSVRKRLLSKEREKLDLGLGSLWISPFRASYKSFEWQHHFSNSLTFKKLARSPK